MAYQANVIQIMIASPGDVSAERNAATEVIYLWNAIYAQATNRVLLPVRWETHSTSDLGGRAQAQINDRVLKFCDLLVGIFWTRLGTPTGEAESGTVEEIKEHLKAGKPAMVFFSRQPVVQDSIDHDEYERLRNFKKWCREQGITWDYEDPLDFRDKFSHQLQIQLTSNSKLAHKAGSLPAPLLLDLAPAKPTPTIPELSSEALQVLTAAAQGHGQILVVSAIGGKIFQAGGKQLGGSDHRTTAAYDFAMDELEGHKLVKAQGVKRQVFQVTKQGYDYLDALNLYVRPIANS
ncbi:hypothetical protein CK489_27720 [Bradyrhizobium sp. UFLA03-84]|uniref:hypothetical protein n=1 Tax=Bradyrhizobium sp. UFLA03-84 TaxID=418599 RepID=UPI000BADECB2|nr:hypothetical protein [Bradyrhizobium sp. UFLA03-84]PAY06662.1 hypothetical protein CK489_27720 [Bradyrhizobium sp. UFLA03-84]